MHSNYNFKHIETHTSSNHTDPEQIYFFHDYTDLKRIGTNVSSHNNAVSYESTANTAINAPVILEFPYPVAHNDHRMHYGHSTHGHRRQLNRKTHQETHIRKQAPLPTPLIHQFTNRITHNNNNRPPRHYHLLEQPSLATTSKILDLSRSSRENKPASTDKHYQHYYSYYYNQDIQTSPERKTGRRLPVLLMASGHGNTYDRNRSRGHCAHVAKNPINTSRLEDGCLDDMESVDNSYVPQNILRETISNNNLIMNYDDENWMKPINELEVINATEHFLDVKDIDIYDKLNITDDNDASQSKRKIRTTSGCEFDDINFKGNGYNNWSNTSLLNNNVSSRHIMSPEKIVRSKERQQMPENEKRHIVKAGPAKKLTSPAPRVLLYSSQSPRLSRIMPSNVRQELRRARKKLPALFSNHIEEYKDVEKVELKSTTVKDSNDVLNGSESKSSSKEDGGNARNGADIERGATGGGNNDSDKESNADDDDDLDDLDNVSNTGDSCDSDTTSGSESGYRLHTYKLSVCMELGNESWSTSQSSDESIAIPSALLVPSLFPNVPPYLAFSSHTEKGPEVPPELYRILKWRVSSVMPKVVRCVLSNSGMRLIKKTNDWMGTWGKHMKSPCFKTIRSFQKINHLPGSFKIGRKDSCWRNLQKQMNMHGKKDFGFMPRTYIIPHDLKLLRKNWPKYSQRNVKWIIKPPASARGFGIRVVNRWAQIPKRKPLIVQKYIERPLLINGSKFDLRLYVLVTSINPLRVFMYHNGLARFAAVKYSDRTETLNDRCMHLTNYSINKFSSHYSKNEDVNACHGHKWTIKSLLTYLGSRGVRTEYLWMALRNLVLRTLLAGENSINNMIKINVESKYSCFELFGFDVLLDADLIPWLLEVNISPSLHSELALDAHVKAPLVQSVLNTALYNVPPKLPIEKQMEIAAQMSLPLAPICYDKRIYINYLSREEKIKHNIFTRKTMEDRDEYINAILEKLTPDDVRCLIVAEDELARSTPLERIFPTNQTYKYLKYTDSPRYYNRLLDAWEARYGFNRDAGIKVLREYCEDRYHLIVPPPPAKKTIKYRTRTLVVTRPFGITTKLSKPLLRWSKRTSATQLYIKRMSTKPNNQDESSSSSSSTNRTSSTSD